MISDKIYNSVSDYFCPSDGSGALVLISKKNQDKKKKNGICYLNAHRLNPIMATYGNHIYFSNYDDQCFSFNTETGIRNQIKELPVPTFYNKNLLLGTINEEQNSCSSIFDLELRKTVKSFKKELFGILENDKFAGSEYWDFNKLHFGKITSDEIFEEDFSKHNYIFDGEKLKGLIYQVIGFFENSVLIHVAPKKILALSLETGQIVWALDDFIANKKVEDYFLFGRKGGSSQMGWHLDIDQSKIHLLSRYFYFTIDLDSQMSNLEKDFLDISENERLNITSTNLVGRKIYFRAEKGLHLSANVIGEFDLDTKKITWLFENPNNSYFTQPPRVSNNTLYALDSSDDLYTFKMS